MDRHFGLRLIIWIAISITSIVLAFVLNAVLAGVFFGIAALLAVFADYFVCSIASAYIAPKIGSRHVRHNRVMIAAFIRAIVYIIGFYWMMSAWLTGGQPLMNPVDANNIWGSTNNFVMTMYILVLIIQNALIVGLTFAMVH